MKSVLISDIRFAKANVAHRSKGLLGWVCLNLDSSLQLDCLALRRTAAGEYALSFPCRTDSNGVMHPYYRPLAEDTRCAIETEVIATLRSRGVLE